MMLLLAFCSHVMWSQSEVWLTSDQADYMAGTTVTLSGDGFFPGETVSIVVNHVGEGNDLTSPSHQPFTVVADGSGHITAQWLVPVDEDEVGAALVATATGLSSNLVAQAFFTDNVKVDFRQSANDDAGYTPPAIHWINSILQQSNSFYQEGMSSLQRVILKDIAPTTGDIHSLSFNHQYTKGGHHAYDFITGNSQHAPVGWNVAVADYNPLIANADPVAVIEAYQCEAEIEGGLSGTCADLHSPGAFYYDIELPDDPFIGVHGPVQTKIDAYEAVSGNRFIRLYGDSLITNAYISCLKHDVPNLGDDGDSDISYVMVVATKSTALSIEMGAHLAIGGSDNNGLHWGANLGAGSINGGPYHFRLEQLGGAPNPTTCAMTEVVSLGAQDNQIKSGDIIPLTCECAISGESGPVCPQSSNQYCAPEGTVTSVWSITGNGTITGSGNCIYVIAGSDCGQSYTLTLIATNADGCTIPCDITVMVSDTLAPIVTADGSVPNNSNLGCNPTSAEINAALGTATATDNCANPFVVYTDSDISTDGCEISQTRTFTATDLCNNSGSATRTISWKVDLVAPVITTTGSVENNSNLGCNPSDAEIDAALGYAISQDDCDGSLPVIVTDGSVSSDGCTRTQTRTFYSEDICGNESSDSRTISWKEDTIDPIVEEAPLDILIECGSSVPTYTPIWIDNCDESLTLTAISSIIHTDCSDIIDQSWFAIDQCGNDATIARSITIVDTTPPTILCPPTVQVDCAQNVPAANTATITASDVCDDSVDVSWEGDVVSNQICANRYTITRSYRATDDCGNSSICSQFILVNDQNAPVITSCPENVNVGCTEDVPAPDLNSISANDGCEGSVLITVDADVISNQTCANRYTITRTYRATDLCGNSSSCEQTITVYDSTIPTITCPENILAGDCATTGICNATAFDNCTDAPVQVSYNYACNYDFPVGSTQVVATAVDACGNSASCNFTVTVVANPVCNLVAPAILPTAGSVGNTLSVVSNANYSYAWTVSGAGWAITDGANSNSITYTAGTLGASGTFCLTITNQYDCTSTCCVTFQSRGLQYCTYTQGFYGGNGKNCSGQKALQVINQALASGGNLVIGTPANNRSLTILTTEGSCLSGKMPAGTAPVMLPVGQVTCATANGPSYLSGGRFVGVIVGQTLTLGLNLRNSSNLGSLVLYGNQFTTAKASSCANGTPVAGTNLTFCLPNNVYNYLSSPKTITKLYNLANQALGGNIPAGMTISDINAAVDAINMGFDQCRILVSFGSCTRSATAQTEDENVQLDQEFGEQLKLTSYPNPMSDDATIEFSSEQDVRGSLELYSSTGELVTTIFSGDLKGGETRVVRFNASELTSGIYICKLSAGDKVQYNKILVSK